MIRLKDHINKIEYFCIIAESKSLKKASEKAYITQPQLTKILKQLEDLLDTQLVVRSPKGISLTKAGAQLHSYGLKIISTINEAEVLIKSEDSGLKGEVTIGTYDSISRYFFPEFLKYMKATVPDLRINLQTGRSSTIYNHLKDNDVDIAIIVDIGFSDPLIENQFIYNDSFGLYQSSTLPEQFNNDLIYFPFAQNNVEKSMKKFGFTQSICCDNLETVKSLTEQSLGVGLLPHKVARDSLLSRKMTPYRHPKIKDRSFDEHQIVMLSKKQGLPRETLFMKDEIFRFLQLWSKT